MGKQNGVSGGGIESNKVVQTPVRYGQPANGVNPGAVSYAGNHIGNHSTEGNGARQDGGATPWNTNLPHNAAQPLGNEVAGNIGRGGPGTGRIVHGCGSKGRHK
jgi:hypothetical protein